MIYLPIDEKYRDSAITTFAWFLYDQLDDDDFETCRKMIYNYYVS